MAEYTGQPAPTSPSLFSRFLQPMQGATAFCAAQMTDALLILPKNQKIRSA
jgi:hypothetical protein